MSLRENLGLSNVVVNLRPKKLYEHFGLLDNPFPPAHKNTGHPHLRSMADEVIEARLKNFLQTGSSEVIVVTGTQGQGKTNLLEYYQRELPPVLSELGTYYVVRYYPDPEPDFGAVVRRIFQELGIEHLKRMAESAAYLTPEARKKALSLIRGREMRDAITALISKVGFEVRLVESSKLMLDYLMGLRVFKRHTDELGVQLRLDSAETKTQALQDIVFFGQAVGCLNGIFLFLDELEKIGGMPTQTTTKYLSAIRALTDALPMHLFLVLAMTSEARSRYARDLPALGSRLQNRVDLPPIVSVDQAIDLYQFYIDQKREEAKQSLETIDWQQGEKNPFTHAEVEAIFAKLLQESTQIGAKGVIQRVFLNRLNALTERVFEAVAP